MNWSMSTAKWNWKPELNYKKSLLEEINETEKMRNS